MIEAVVFDWAGTTVDYGCFAPVQAFMEAFAHFGIEVTMEETRNPMGMLKIEHIRTMLQMERIAKLWADKYGRSANDEDVRAIYEQFEPKLFSILHRYFSPKPFVLDAVAELRRMGMKIGSTTEMMGACSSFWPKAHVDAETMAKLAEFPYKNRLFDNIGVPFCMTVEAEAMGAKVDLGDEFTEPRVCEYAIGTVTEHNKLQPIQMDEGRRKVVLDAIRLLCQSSPDAAIIGNITGPISTASSLIDANVFYRELRKEKAAAHAALDFVTEQLIAFGKAQIEAGAEFIAIADPSGTGEILGPKLFEEYALPALNRICEELKPLCKGVIVHICGQLRTIYPQLAKLKCSGLSVDAVVNIKELRKNLPNMAIIGNISTFALAGGNAAVIQNLCNSTIDGGVDVLAPACGLGTTSTVESISIMMKTAIARMEQKEKADA